MAEQRLTRDKLVGLMDALIEFSVRVATSENAQPQEIASLPAVVGSIVQLTNFAVIEEKN